MFGSSLGKFRVTGWWEEGASVLVAYISVAFARREGGGSLSYRLGAMGAATYACSTHRCSLIPWYSSNGHAGHGQNDAVPMVQSGQAAGIVV